MIPLKMFPELEKTADCSMCGKCCEAILIPVSSEEMKPDSGIRFRDGDFMRENFVPMTQEEAFRINPNLADPLSIEKKYYYSCKQYDKTTKLCGAHENRPQVCSGFPWYGNSINNQSLLMHKECSYWLDVPVEAWPSGVEV